MIQIKYLINITREPNVAAVYYVKDNNAVINSPLVRIKNEGFAESSKRFR